MSESNEKIVENLKVNPLLTIGTDVVTVLLTATLLCLPMEDGRFWPLGFVAFVPILLRMWSRSYWAIFVMGFFAIYLFKFYTLQWIDVYGLHWRVLLVFMNAIMYGAGFMVAFWIMRRYKCHFFATILPTILVLIDFNKSLGFLGFPWPVICHSQAENLPLIQIASITGSWGITFLLGHVNEALAHLFAGEFKTKILPVAISPVILIAIFGLYGALSLAKTLPATDIQATIVQWDEATDVEWTEGFTRRAVDAYADMTIEELESVAGSTSVDSEIKRVVIWPETSIPDATRNWVTMDRIRQLAATYNATVLVGCLTNEPAESEPWDPEQVWIIPEEYRQFNSLVAFEPDGTIVPIYSKIKVVPFGEVIPLKELITEMFPEYPWGTTDITQGTGIYVADTGVGKIGSIICYESFFPQVARQLIAEGAEILVLVSNTSWFGRSKASSQHARFDVFRAVENRTWFCRAATTGISSVIDPLGHRIVETGLFVADAVTVPISRREGMSLYSRWGDWVPMLCGLYIMLLLLGVFLIREEEEQRNLE